MALPGDAGSSQKHDAGLPHDGGMEADAGLPDAGRDGGEDAGVSSPSCARGETLVDIETSGEPLSLGALAVGPDRIAIAYRRGQTAVLQIVDGSGQIVASPEVSGLGALEPKALAYGGGRFLLAGANELGSGVAFFDQAGVQGGLSTFGDVQPMGVAQVGEGGFMLAVGRAPTGGGERAISGLWLGSDAAVLDLEPMAASQRSSLQWDLAWRAQGDGVACGSAIETEQEWLALYGQGTRSGATVLTTEPIAPRGAAPDDFFGCRLSLDEDLVAVALAESGGQSRLVWLSANGTALAGPTPFLGAPLQASHFDVASSAAATALAFFDPAGAPRVAVRLYPSPGASPIELDADDGLDLGDFTVGTVRVESRGGGYLVAFDATQRAGPSHLFVRELVCGP
jgi:hypothetical protein